MGVKLTKEQTIFIKMLSSMVNDGKHDWYHMPCFFKHLGGTEFDIMTFDQIPEGLSDTINKIREKL